ncbi:glycoside hydrolase family 18 protein [Botryobasidium botryosum FD-172 SS1]|uniref:Glycoside hydrolase family 18 protein n=1 Tax=Botryobasidium botryosum (strain FD-172 SS1) TaxID=930990 RepID=A0A067N9D1_BOTB1|nr:glycoside hydrolase family 18 protein [Botryobasidium botryosum FD-172 SS1]
MVSFSRLSTALALLASFAATVVAAPAEVLPTQLVDRAALAESQKPPRWAIYWDEWVANEQGLPSVEKLNGFNVLYLSFWLPNGPADQALEWTRLSAASRKSMKAQYEKAGIKVMVSAFGETVEPVTSKADAVATANKIATFVKQYDLDGVDIDFEDLPAMNKADGKAEAWLATLTKTLRTELPAGQYAITHAPVAPWFDAKAYRSGAYTQVHKDVGDIIDWYNIQFYNQGATAYTTCETLNYHSGDPWPETSVMQIAETVGLHKAVVGKIATPKDGTNGFMDDKTLAECLAKLKAKGWDAGAMVWEYPNADSTWIKTVRSQSWPV